MSQPIHLMSHPALSGVRTAVTAMCAAGAGGVWQLTDDEVESTIEVLDRLESAVVATRARLLREADDRSLRERTGAPSTQRWLADRFRWSRGLAATRLREAVALGSHPVLEDALAGVSRPTLTPVPDPGSASVDPDSSGQAGEVTAEQAAVLVPALDAVCGLERVEAAQKDAASRFLVAQAAMLTPRELARAAQELLEALTAARSVDPRADEQALAASMIEPSAQRRATSATKRGPAAGRAAAVAAGSSSVPTATPLPAPGSALRERRSPARTGSKTSAAAANDSATAWSPR